MAAPKPTATKEPTKTPPQIWRESGYTPLGGNLWRGPDGRTYQPNSSGTTLVVVPQATATPQPTKTFDQKAADKNAQKQADAAYITPTATATPKPKTFTDTELMDGWIHEDPDSAGKTKAEYLKTLDSGQIQSLEAAVAAGKVPPHMQRALDEKAGEAAWANLGGPMHAEPPTSDLSQRQPPDELDAAEQQQILDQSRSQPAAPPRSQPSPGPAAGNIAGPPPIPAQHGGGFRNWTNPSGQNDFDPNQATYYSTAADKAHQAGAWWGSVGGAGGVATGPSQNYSYTPGFKMGGHMAIRGPATLYDDATGQPIAKLGENRPEEMFGHPDGSVGIMNHIPSGLRGFATGGTIDPNNPVATSGGNPPMATQPDQPAQSYSGLSFPGTTVGGYSLQGLNAGTIPSSPFNYNGTGNIPQGQDVNQLENQSYGYLSGLQNYKSGFDTNLQNTLAGINTARQDALTRMAGAEVNEPARLAAQHLRDVYDPHYGMAGVAKPQEIAPPVGTFGTPETPATTSGVGLRWQLQTPQEAYNRINQPLSEYESLIGKTASGVFSQITDAQDKARFIIAALKGENPSKPNPNGPGLVPSNFKDPNADTGGGGGGGGSGGTGGTKLPAGVLPPVGGIYGTGTPPAVAAPTPPPNRIYSINPNPNGTFGGQTTIQPVPVYNDKQQIVGWQFPKAPAGWVLQ